MPLLITFLYYIVLNAEFKKLISTHEWMFYLKYLNFSGAGYFSRPTDGLKASLTQSNELFRWIKSFKTEKWVNTTKHKIKFLCLIFMFMTHFQIAIMSKGNHAAIGHLTILYSIERWIQKN